MALKGSKVDQYTQKQNEQNQEYYNDFLMQQAQENKEVGVPEIAGYKLGQNLIQGIFKKYLPSSDLERARASDARIEEISNRYESADDPELYKELAQAKFEDYQESEDPTDRDEAIRLLTLYDAFDKRKKDSIPDQTEEIASGSEKTYVETMIANDSRLENFTTEKEKVLFGQALANQFATLSRNAKEKNLPVTTEEIYEASLKVLEEDNRYLPATDNKGFLSSNYSAEYNPLRSEKTVPDNLGTQKLITELSQDPANLSDRRQQRVSKGAGAGGLLSTLGSWAVGNKF